MEEEGSADEDFWNQDFFEEEAQDIEYNSSNASEAEEPDVPDSDFDESEAESESGDEAEEDRRRPRRQQLKPPGQTRPATKRPPDRTQHTKAVVKQPVRAASGLEQQAEAPTLRHSTRQRVEDAEKERFRAEQQTGKLKKKRIEPELKLLTQAELLAEAAHTEIENMKSLETMVAQEEEVKKRATAKKGKYMGPMLRFSSKCIDGEAVTSLEVMNMLVPPELRGRRAPTPSAPVLCAVTGRPACYQDPQSGLPYADLPAFTQLRSALLQGRPLSLSTPPPLHTS